MNISRVKAWDRKISLEDPCLASRGLSELGQNCDLEEQIFLSHPHTNNGFSFLLTISFGIFTLTPPTRLHIIHNLIHPTVTIYTGLDNKKFHRKIVNIFLPIIFSICFGCSKEPSL